MRVAVTGTPGTGKTTATDRLTADVPVIHLNDVVREEGFVARHDEERDTDVVDLEALAAWVESNAPADVVLESHLAHHLEAERVVVLRAHPDTLGARLSERGEPPASVEENAESEALDLILSEAVERHGEERVYEIDTTDRTPGSIAGEIDDVIAGRRDPAVGVVSFVDALREGRE